MLLAKPLERIYFKGIVFNQSWEDPEMDRQALHVQPSDTVLSITSGGCSSLNLLCLGPQRLITTDANPSQNYLMELKRAAIRSLDHETFFDIFGAWEPKRIDEVYHSDLRLQLSEGAQRFWDKRLDNLKKGLYTMGKMALFCRILRLYLFRTVGRQTLYGLFDLESLEEQERYYRDNIEKKLWKKSTNWFLNLKPVIYLAGIHPNQLELVDKRVGVYDFARKQVSHVLTRIPIKQNYFLAQAILGRYLDKENVPPYLRAENYPRLQSGIDKMDIVTGWLGPTLDAQEEGSVNKFNLLDIFDWMDEEQFEGALRSVIRAGADGGRLIYRSGIYDLPAPDSLKDHLEPHEDLAKQLLDQDRSILYGAFHVYTIHK